MNAPSHSSRSSLAALDIGGANLKAAHGNGQAFTVPFAVWKSPRELSERITAALARLPAFRHLAATTTAELCDCFETKEEGVLAILQALESAARAVAPEATMWIWTTAGGFSGIEARRADPLPAAAANWLALATYAGALTTSPRALLADLGSTTLDLIPLLDGRPAPGGYSDTERLLSGELIYTGVRRTPLFSICPEVPFRGALCPTIPELFATLADVHVWRGDLPEDAADRQTADGRELTRERCLERLARVVGADRSSFHAEDARLIAEAAAARQLEKVALGLRKMEMRLGQPPRELVISGEGEFLLRRAALEVWPDCPILSTGERFGVEISRAACAFSLLALLSQQLGEPPHR